MNCYRLRSSRILAAVLAVSLVFCLMMIGIPSAHADSDSPYIYYTAVDDNGNPLPRVSNNSYGVFTAGDHLTLRLEAVWPDGEPLDPSWTYIIISEPDGKGGTRGGVYEFDDIDEPNVYYHTIYFDDTWVNGDYIMDRVQAVSMADKSCLAFANYGGFTVVGCGEEDNEGPVLDEFSIEKKNLRPGDTLNLTAKAHDEQTTMGRSRISVIPGDLKAVFASGDNEVEVSLSSPQDGEEYSGSLEMNESIPYGTYTLKKLIMKDRLKNTTEFDPAAEGLDLKDYQFTYSDQDTTAPEILDIQLSAQEVAVGDTLTFTLKATDASGLDLDKTQINYSNSKKSYALKFKATDEPDVYKASVVIPSSYDKGTYNVKTLRVYDTEGNVKLLSFDSCTFKVVYGSSNGSGGGNSGLWFLRNIGYEIAKAVGAGGRDFDTTFSIIDYVISIIS